MHRVGHGRVRCIPHSRLRDGVAPATVLAPRSHDLHRLLLLVGVSQQLSASFSVVEVDVQGGGPLGQQLTEEYGPTRWAFIQLIDDGFRVTAHSVTYAYIIAPCLGHTFRVLGDIFTVWGLAKLVARYTVIYAELNQKQMNLFRAFNYIAWLGLSMLGLYQIGLLWALCSAWLAFSDVTVINDIARQRSGFEIGFTVGLWVVWAVILLMSDVSPHTGNPAGRDSTWFSHSLRHSKQLMETAQADQLQRQLEVRLVPLSFITNRLDEQLAAGPWLTRILMHPVQGGCIRIPFLSILPHLDRAHNCGAPGPPARAHPDGPACTRSLLWTLQLAALLVLAHVLPLCTLPPPPRGRRHRACGRQARRRCGRGRRAV